MGSLAQLSIIKGLQEDFKFKKLHRIFEKNLVNYAHKTALVYGDISENNGDGEIQTRQTNFCQLNQNSNRLARVFISEARQHNLKPNSDGDYVIAVCMRPSDRLVTILLSIWKAGAAYLPIDPSFPENRITHIINEARPIMIVHDDNTDDRVFGNSAHTQSFSTLLQKSHDFISENLTDREILEAGSTHMVALILYTSGSTGIPKGVRLPHSTVLNRLKWQWDTFPYAQDETIGVFKTALTFVDSVSEIWGPLLSGIAILVVPKEITKDPERLVSRLEHYKIQRLVLVPTLLRSLLMYLQLEGTKMQQTKLLYKLQLWICSGEPLPVPLASQFFEYFEEGVHTLCNFYGSTEVMGDVTYFVCENRKQLSQYDRVPIGLPISNTIIYLLDNDLRPVKRGERGEVHVAGCNLASGYVNGRDVEKFIDNPLAVELTYSRLYRTGDYASLCGEYLIYEGRTDSQIKIRGHRVDLSEIEKHVNQLETVEKAVVLCYHAGQLDQGLIAFVKPYDHSPLFTELQLERILEGKFADYMRPQVKIVEDIPLLVNGKVDRQALYKMYETANNNENDLNLILDYDYTDIPDELMETARILFETVGNVIGRSTRTTLSGRSNFYELGGNSLNSIFTVTLLREKGFNIGMSEFIAAKNLSEILLKMNEADCGAVPVEDDWSNACPHLCMEARPLRMDDKETVINIIVESFYGKADLEQWLKPDISPSDYSDLINYIWLPLLEKNLSFIVIDANTGRTIATALTFDALDEPEVVVRSELNIIFEFLESLEGPIRETYLPKGLNKILHSFMMGTIPELNAQENIACMHFMEKKVLEMAREKKFAGILTTNTSPLTQQLGSDVYHYKTLLDYQVNEYVHSDGTRPFANAPDSQRAIVHWNEVSQ